MNPFYFCYSKRYYLTHPWKFFRDLWRGIIESYRRIRYGWCHSDVWNFDSWFLNVVPEMLEYLSQHAVGYPASGPYNDPDSWKEWLHSTAVTMKNRREKEREAANEYKDSGYTADYFRRAREIDAETRERFVKAMSEFAQNMEAIWD